jgi:DNA-binding winged helix-turn-helix (wHTH) protein/Tol biopolymer transport system component
MPNVLLRFGPFELDCQTRTLLRGDAIVQLTPKEFDTLQCLVENAGKVVSKKKLTEFVWPGQPFLSDSNLAHHVKALRRKLGEGSEGDSFIRTAVGEGYHLSVPVTAVPAEESAPPPDSLPASRSPVTEKDLLWITRAEVLAPRKDPLASPLPRKNWSNLVFAAIVGGLVTTFGAVVREAVRGAEPRVTDSRRLTSDGRPKDGPLVTDGRLVYFTEHVSHDADSDTRPAATPHFGGDVSNPQTPVSSAILLDIAARTGDRLYWSSHRFRAAGSVLLWKSKGGSLQPTGLTTEQVSISPDGRTLAYGDADYNLHIRDLGSSSAVRAIPIRGRAHQLRWSVDGGRIRFSVLEEPGSLSASLWEVRRDGSNLRQLPVPAEHGKGLMSEGWTADGRYFIFSEHGVLDHHASLWIMRDDWLSLKPAKPVRLSTMLDFSAAVAADDSTIFAIGTMSHNEVARFGLEKRAFVSFWEGFPAIDVSFSNDGAWAAFARYPESTLWVSRADGSERRQVTWPTIVAHQPHWSPDGHLIAFMGQKPGKPWRIYVVDAAGGVPQEVKPDDPFDQGVPSWSTDGRFLVFGELRGRKPDADMVIRVLDPQTGAESILPGSKGKWSPRWAPNRRSILAQTTDFKELDLFDCKSQTCRTLARVQSDDASWSLDGKFIHFQANTERGRALCRIRVDDGKVEQLALQPEKEYSWSGVAPDGSPLTFRALKIEEIYALEVRLP